MDLTTFDAPSPKTKGTRGVLVDHVKGPLMNSVVEINWVSKVAKV